MAMTKHHHEDRQNIVDRDKYTEECERHLWPVQGTRDTKGFHDVLSGVDVRAERPHGGVDVDHAEGCHYDITVNVSTWGWQSDDSVSVVQYCGIAHTRYNLDGLMQNEVTPVR